MINKWRHECAAVKNDPYCWVYDGNKQMYSTKSLRAIPNCTIIIEHEGKQKEFIVSDVKYDATIKIDEDLLSWATKGQSGTKTDGNGFFKKEAKNYEQRNKIDVHALVSLISGLYEMWSFMKIPPPPNHIIIFYD